MSDYDVISSQDQVTLEVTVENLSPENGVLILPLSI